MTSRNITPGFIRESQRADSQELPLAFLTITHPRLSQVIRVVSDAKDYVLGGQTYQGFDFRIVLLTDNAEVPSARLEVQNVSRTLSDILLDVSEPAKVNIEMIAASQFDLTQDPRTEIESPSARIYRAELLDLIDVNADALTLSGRLIVQSFVREPYPGIFTTQDRFPGLYR